MTEIARQIDDLASLAGRLHDLAPEIDEFARQIIGSLEGGGKVLWMGNGGSAAESQHLSTELVGRLTRERKGLASIALTSDGAAMTAISNDFGFQRVFSRQVEALCNTGDVVVGLSTSGTSANVIEGLREAQAVGGFTVCLTGDRGGEVAAMSDLSLCVPSSDTQRIQEAHLLIGHIVCDLVELAFVGDDSSG